MVMSGIGILWVLLIGLAAGAVAGWLMKGKSFGIVINILVGIAGSFIGGWIYGLLGVTANNMWGVLLMAIVGAVVLLWVLSLFKVKKS